MGTVSIQRFQWLHGGYMVVAWWFLADGSSGYLMVSVATDGCCGYLMVAGAT
jgi:hypothetical protein